MTTEATATKAKTPAGAKKAPPGAKPATAAAPSGAKAAPAAAKAPATAKTTPKAPPGAKGKSDAPPPKAPAAAKGAPAPKAPKAAETADPATVEERPDAWKNEKEPANKDEWRDQVVMMFLAALSTDIYRAIVAEQGEEAGNAAVAKQRSRVTMCLDAVKRLEDEQDVLFYRLPPSARALLCGENVDKDRRLNLVRRAVSSNTEMLKAEEE